MNDNLPRHVAIVMDGNGRWAAHRGLPRVDGHRAGVDSVNASIQCCLKYNIPVLSLFAFSSENWGRPEAEVACLMELFLQALSKYLDELDKKGVSLRFSGYRDDLSLVLQEKMHQAEQRTAVNNSLIVNVVINYGGRWDIVQAAKKIAVEVQAQRVCPEAIDEVLFAKHLNTYGLAEPDLFIRTSGEQRLSNFFLWQLAYTELYFTPVYWPDFSTEEFEKALMSFRDRERRYGKVSSLCNEISYV